MSYHKPMGTYLYAESKSPIFTHCCCCMSLINGIRVISVYSLIFGMAFIFLGSSIGGETTVFTIIYYISLLTGIWFLLWFLCLLLLQSLGIHLTRIMSVWTGKSLNGWLVVIFMFYTFVQIMYGVRKDQDSFIIALLTVISFLSIVLTLYSILVLKSYMLTLQERRPSIDQTFNQDNFLPASAVTSGVSLASLYRLKTSPNNKRLNEMLRRADESASKLNMPVWKGMKGETQAVELHLFAAEDANADMGMAPDKQFIMTLSKSQQTSPCPSVDSVDIDDTEKRPSGPSPEDMLRHIESLRHEHIL